MKNKLCAARKGEREDEWERKEDRGAGETEKEIKGERGKMNDCVLFHA